MTPYKCIESLEENPIEVFLEVSSILLKLVDNVLLYPSNPKYRKLRLENKLVSTVIMPSIGAMECLFEIGFQEGDDALLLPPENTSIEKLTSFRTEISNRRKKYLKESGNSSTDKNGTQPSLNVHRQPTPQPEASSQAKPNITSNISSSSNPFLANLHKLSSGVLQYELDSTKRKAVSVIPLNNINEKVQARMRQHQKQALKNSQPINEGSLQETIFLMELMTWFKNDFFEWVNAPKCSNCSCDTQFLEMSSDPRELAEADRVEVYKCGKCTARVLFPRINNAAMLLDTRKGRCGEWANAFTALCRALGWEARYVWDQTDHVWTEVYFKSEQRWVHCDPCECALDKPLLYEKGWGKKLCYIIAFSCEEAQDVTWRYSADHNAVLARRKHCSEKELLQTILQINKLRQANLTIARKKTLAHRTVLELVQLMSPAATSEGDMEGRQSGSLAWRLARAETTLDQADNTPYVWTPTAQEVEARKMVISYCSATDEYRRGVGGDSARGWRTRAFAADNVFRKEEKDWKTVYLSRTEDSAQGRVSWQVDVLACGLQIDQVEVTCPSTTYETGKVIWLLCSGDKCVRINNGQVKTSEMRGSTSVTLSASLSGGKGSVAWQHAQILRQPLDACEAILTFSVTFTNH